MKITQMMGPIHLKEDGWVQGIVQEVVRLQVKILASVTTQQKT